MIADLNLPLAVVCHDAGAANIIFGWLRHHLAVDSDAEKNWRVCLDGPARNLWLADSALSKIQLVDDLGCACSGVATILSGTGWASDLEHRARVIAKENKQYSLAVIDHWVNYAPRFSRNGQMVLPDTIIVTDHYAEAEAKRSFPDLPIVVYPNQYLLDSLAKISPATDDGGILYVLEPIHAPWAKDYPGEFQALDFFVANSAKLFPDGIPAIRLRPHPSDVAGKYDNWIFMNSELQVSLDTHASLVDSITCATWVLGAETYAMVVALEAGRHVVSTLPTWGHACRLPHEGIIHLRDMVS